MNEVSLPKTNRRRESRATFMEWILTYTSHELTRLWIRLVRPIEQKVCFQTILRSSEWWMAITIWTTMNTYTSPRLLPWCANQCVPSYIVPSYIALKSSPNRCHISLLLRPGTGVKPKTGLRQDHDRARRTAGNHNKFSSGRKTYG